MIKEPLELLGRRLDDTDVQVYLSLLGPASEPEEEDNDEGVEKIGEYVSFMDSGVEIESEAGVVQAVFLYPGGEDGFAAYRGPMPLATSMTDTQSDIRRLLGTPTFHMPAKELPFLGRRGPVDRYDRPAYSVAFDYDEHSGGIRLLTVMHPDAVPKP